MTILESEADSSHQKRIRVPEKVYQIWIQHSLKLSGKTLIYILTGNIQTNKYFFLL